MVEGRESKSEEVTDSGGDVVEVGVYVSTWMDAIESLWRKWCS